MRSLLLALPLVFLSACGMQPMEYPTSPSDTPEGDGIISGTFSLGVAEKAQEEEFKQWKEEKAKEIKTEGTSQEEYEEFKAWKEQREYEAFLEWKKQQEAGK